jgi:integrase
MKLTAAWLTSRSKTENRPAKRRDATVDGRRGLMVRVSPNGEVSFRFRYMYAGRRRVMVLGTFGDGELSLADAFEAHYSATRALAKGIDPADERERIAAQREKERREREEADTVASLVDQFVHRKLRAERWDAKHSKWVRDLKSKIRPRKRPEAAEALLRANLIEAKIDGQTIGSMKAHELTRRMAIKIGLKISDRGSPVTANRVHALMVQLFEWGASMDIVPASVMAGTVAPGGEETPRKRALSDDEIHTVWNKLTDARMEEPTRIALKLLLLTGQRRGQLTLAQWQHFDLPQKLWTIPVELQKSEGRGDEPTKPHVVPLPPDAMELVLELHALTGSERWVLPSKHNTKKSQQPYSERALTRAVAKNQTHFGIPHWTPHDFRRTTITGLSKLQVSRLHIKKVVGHKIDDVTDDYDQHDFLKEKRAALELWCAHVRAVVNTAKETKTPNTT